MVIMVMDPNVDVSRLCNLSRWNTYFLSTYPLLYVSCPNLSSLIMLCD